MTAVISPCGLYRYHLQRSWGADWLTRNHHAKNGPCCFIMLNPSTADATADDPTIRRCMRFAQDFGCDSLEVVNLFALRSPSPKVLYDADRKFIVGPDNDHYLIDAAKRAHVVVCAWGQHGKLFGRGAEVLKLLRRYWIHPTALRLNADGAPAHPLYLPADLRPVPLEET